MPAKNILSRLRQIINNLIGQTDRSAELYKSLFAKSHSTMLIIHPTTGHIIDANDSACAYYRYAKDDLTAMSIMDINTLTPSEIQAEMDMVKSEQKNYFSFRHRLATGEIRDVEVYSSPIMLAGQKVLYSIIHDITARKKIEQEREHLIKDLEKALTEIKILRGILPLCSFCKKIRDRNNSWQEVDSYIHHHSEAAISHTVCPECLTKHYPEDDSSDPDQ